MKSQDVSARTLDHKGVHSAIFQKGGRSGFLHNLTVKSKMGHLEADYCSLVVVVSGPQNCVQKTHKSRQTKFVRKQPKSSKSINL